MQLGSEVKSIETLLREQRAMWKRVAHVQAFVLIIMCFSLIALVVGSL